MSGDSGKLSDTYLERNGFPIDCDYPSRDLLLRVPAGAYTGMRMVEQSQIFKFDFHCERMRTSVRLMREQDESMVNPEKSETKDPYAPMDDKDVEAYIGTLADMGIRSIDDVAALGKKNPMRQVMEHFVKRAVQRYFQIGKRDSAIHKVQAYCGWRLPRSHTRSPFDFYVHVSKLTEPPTPPRSVLLCEGGRSNPNAKDSSWVTESKSLPNVYSNSKSGFSLKDAPLNESVMYASNTGRLYEGVSSNIIMLCRKADLPWYEEPQKESEKKSEGRNQTERPPKMDGYVLVTPATGMLRGSVLSFAYDMLFDAEGKQNGYGIDGIECDELSLRHMIDWKQVDSSSKDQFIEPGVVKGLFVVSTTRILMPIKYAIVPKVDARKYGGQDVVDEDDRTHLVIEYPSFSSPHWGKDSPSVDQEELSDDALAMQYVFNCSRESYAQACERILDP